QPSTREELPEDDADREDVGARVYRLPLSRLRRQIAELALDDAGLAVLELAVRFGEPEVHDLHLPVPRDEHVGGRHVAVDDAEALPLSVLELVRVREALADPDADEARDFNRERLPQALSVLDQRLEVGAVHVLHHDEVGVVADPDVEDLNAVRVGEVRGQARLVQEHPHELLLLGEVRENALDRDGLLEAFEPGTLGSEDLRHATGRDLLDYLVALLGLSHRYAPIGARPVRFASLRRRRSQGQANDRLAGRDLLWPGNRGIRRVHERRGSRAESRRRA